MSNTPPMSQSSETLTMLQNHLPERCVIVCGLAVLADPSVGAIILYQTPWLFETLLAAVKPILDPYTYSKVAFSCVATSQVRYIFVTVMRVKVGKWIGICPISLGQIGENWLMVSFRTRFSFPSNFCSFEGTPVGRIGARL